jgi:hypothetical protein
MKILCHKEPLLDNDRGTNSYTTDVAREWPQQIRKKNSGRTGKRCSSCSPCDSCVSQQEKTRWERRFLCGPCRGYITKTSCDYERVYESTSVEAGSITSTVTLRVVGGDENGSLKSGTVKYGRESQETRTRERLS